MRRTRDRRRVPVILENLLVGPHLLEPGLDLESGLVDERARPLLAIDGAFLLQAGEGVANGRPADPELGGQFGLGTGSGPARTRPRRSDP